MRLPLILFVVVASLPLSGCGKSPEMHFGECRATAIELFVDDWAGRGAETYTQACMQGRGYVFAFEPGCMSFNNASCYRLEESAGAWLRSIFSW